MGLKIPEEKEEIKRQIHGLRSAISDAEKRDSLAVWFGNIIPKYLWESWKNELKKEGWNWQRFLKLLSYRTGDAILYIEGKITWESFVKKVMEGVYGELGEIIKKG
jgi:hypothetical protein